MTNYNGTARTFDAANRLAGGGFTYDANGNLTSDGTHTYTWDRANRLLTVGNTNYQYNGDGNRVSQTVNSVVTQYLLDTQPGLALVLAETTGTDTTRYIHSPRGIHMIQDASENWYSVNLDGLGSVCNVVDGAGEVLSAHNYTPYGVPDSALSGFAFTGEQCDSNGLQYHRARYYAPGLGIFPSVDPFEGIHDRPMSLNGYSWVEGNPVMNVDPSGMCTDPFTCIALVAGLGVLALALGGCSTPTSPRSGILPRGAISDQDIKDSTVTIKVKRTCSGQGFANLGTITSSGIWTHDHYYFNDPAIPLASLNTPSTTPNGAATNLKSWPCISITGKNGSINIDGTSATSINIISSSAANILIDPSQVDMNGNPVDLRTLGVQASVALGWKPSMPDQKIRVPHILGNNETADVSQHSNIGVFSLTLDTNGPVTAHQRSNVYKSTANEWYGDVDYIQPGDSGGGVFADISGSDFLIGVTLGRDIGIISHTLGFNMGIKFTHFFLPLS